MLSLLLHHVTIKETICEIFEFKINYKINCFLIWLEKHDQQRESSENEP